MDDSEGRARAADWAMRCMPSDVEPRSYLAGVAAATRVGPAQLEHAMAGLVVRQINGQDVALKRVGRRWRGMCPACDAEGHTLSASDEGEGEGLYYCYGCGLKGRLS